MNLTDDVKKQIDELSYIQLLTEWRFAPLGSPMFQGESGKYWSKRMFELRSGSNGDEMHVTASKNVGWDS